ncbi:hypothetical protein SGLAM104S_07725 [Streptomyces glaucescens]
MRSTPSISGGRPETVVPKTMSSRPVWVLRAMPQAAWTTLLRVMPRLRASAPSVAVASPSRTAVTSAPATAARPASGATWVGSARPAKASRQAARAASLSCRSSQARWSR